MKVLIADDDEVSLIRLESLLTKQGYEVMTASDGGQAWQILEGKDPPRLAILDWMMPEFDGLEVCRRVREDKDGPYVYLIILTARTQKEDLIQGLASGADDYLTKPFDEQELQVRLRACQRILELQEALLFHATHDALTGIWNRRMILEMLSKEISYAKRTGNSLGVIMADLDHFKAVNDRYGHQVGDAVLREVGERLKASLRPYDSLGRYGGEEFLVVAPDCGLQDAGELAERLRRQICQQPLNTPARTLTITASFGIAVGRATDLDQQKLILSADQALYQAKEKGRNRVEGG